MSRYIGIDVSEFNGRLDWAKIKAAGIRFAIIRSGYGVTHVDPQFAANLAGAVSNGIPVGVYHFSYALSVAGARREAEFVLSLLAPHRRDITLPVFFDFEQATVDYAAGQGVTLGRAAFNAHTRAFCQTIQAAGYGAGVYYNLDFYRRFVDPAALRGFAQWYAQYAARPAISDFDIWQYSDNYHIAGINGAFDGNELKNLSLLGGKEEVDMTRAEVEKLIDERIARALSGAGKPVSDWAKEEWAEAIAAGITDGSHPQGCALREEVAAMVLRARDGQ